MALTRCNICLEENNVLIPINAENDDNLTALQKLQIVIPCQDWVNCHSICFNCSDLLETSYHFITLCNQNEIERQTLIQEEKEISGQKKDELNSSLSELDNLDTITEYSAEEKMEIITIKIEPLVRPKNNKIAKDRDDVDIVPPANHECNSTSEDIELKKVKCMKCSKMFPNSHELGKHMSVDHGFKCKLCSKDFRTRGSLGQHIRLEHAKKITCEMCGETFSKPEALVEHCNAQHSQTSDEVKPYTCDICKKRFSCRTSLSRHTRYHENVRNFTCKMCGKCFVTKKDVDMHELIHGDEKNFCCKTCGKLFKTLSNLRTHMRCVHSDPSERKYECHVCSKRFTLKSSIEDHIKRHVGLKEYSCLICGASFIAKYDLKRHMYRHTKDRPYKCELCKNKSYRDGKGLKDHIEKYH